MQRPGGGLGSNGNERFPGILDEGRPLAYLRTRLILAGGLLLLLSSWLVRDQRRCFPKRGHDQDDYEDKNRPWFSHGFSHPSVDFRAPDPTILSDSRTLNLSGQSRVFNSLHDASIHLIHVTNGIRVGRYTRVAAARTRKQSSGL